MKIVLKIGGSLFEEDLHFLYEDVCHLVNDEHHDVVIVHGGGPQIDLILKNQGKDPKFLISQEGVKSRHTDEDTRDAAIMALGGLVNKGITAALIKHEVNAFGFTGVDGAIMMARRKDKIVSVDPATSKRIVVRNDFSGRIDPDKVKGDIIIKLLELGIVPVIGALAISDDGTILNTDGDRAAACVCKAINGDVFISVTDVPGVLKDMDSQEVISSIPVGNLDAILESVSGGMKKKIIAVKEAVSFGIPRVIITSGLVEHGISKALAGEAGSVITQ
ncbi:MAG TPA: acetylglutamate kinase [Candidatus Lokiarchaeia archaeon]|nr:acetylglutamate kinase [Candidatus Lokiarchaeia archaeon]